MFIKDLSDAVCASQTGSDGTAYDLNLLAELDFLVTQRRIRSLYHGNVELQSQTSDFLLSSQTDFPEVFSDTMWDDFFAASFDVDESYSLHVSDSPGLEQSNPLHTFRGNSTGFAENTAELKLPEDIEAALKSLPSCSFCREKHVRCDQKLPQCVACDKANRRCTYHDPVLLQDFPRE